MSNTELSSALTRLFTELVDGTATGGEAFILNSGDLGLLRSLDRLSGGDASQSVNAGATIAAHAQHVRYGLSLMNRWAREGGNPFADATWDAAWKLSTVTDAEWEEIRSGLRHEAAGWREVLRSPPDVRGAELCGIVGSLAHLAYHLGAIRQIATKTRGPREGTFPAA